MNWCGKHARMSVIQGIKHSACRHTLTLPHSIDHQTGMCYWRQDVLWLGLDHHRYRRLALLHSDVSRMGTGARPQLELPNLPRMNKLNERNNEHKMNEMKEQIQWTNRFRNIKQWNEYAGKQMFQYAAKMNNMMWAKWPNWTNRWNEQRKWTGKQSNAGVRWERDVEWAICIYVFTHTHTHTHTDPYHTLWSPYTHTHTPTYIHANARLTIHANVDSLHSHKLENVAQRRGGNAPRAPAHECPFL